jgi:hypothetical protein
MYILLDFVRMDFALFAFELMAYVPYFDPAHL